MNRPSIRQLESLVAVADAKSFRKAAIVLGLSQPALSASVAAAEQLLGVQVFERDRRAVLITPAGEEVVGRARLALARVDAARGGGGGRAGRAADRAAPARRDPDDRAVLAAFAVTGRAQALSAARARAARGSDRAPAGAARRRSARSRVARAAG